MENLIAFFEKRIIDNNSEHFKGSRSQIFISTILFIFILGISSVVFNLIFTISSKAILESVIFSVAFIFLLISVFGRTLDYQLRLYLIVFFLYSTSVLMMMKWGLHSYGQFFLFLIPIIAAIFRQKSMMIIFLIINALTFTYLRIVVLIGLLEYPNILKFDTSEWVLFALGFLFVNTFVSFFFYYLINSLVGKSDAEQTEIENLSHEMTKLNRVNVKFQTLLDESKEFTHQEFHSKRMESIGRLTNGIAHEFNNFITVIVGYTDILISIGCNNDIYYQLLKKLKLPQKLLKP